TVARNTPPFTPTSSPSTTTRSSCAISQASAIVTASTSATLAMTVLARTGVGDADLTLLDERVGELRVHVVEHALRRRWRRVRVGLYLGVDLLRTFFQQHALLLLAPRTDAEE